jgi:hypothetical protein
MLKPNFYGALPEYHDGYTKHNTFLYTEKKKPLIICSEIADQKSKKQHQKASLAGFALFFYKLTLKSKGEALCQ